MLCSRQWYLPILSAVTMVLGGCQAGSQSPPLPPVAERLEVQTPRPVELEPGQRSEAIVYVTVRNGFHVQAHVVPFAYLVPTRIDPVGIDHLELGEPVYPPGKLYQLKGSPDTLSVYDGTFEIRIPVRALDGAPWGSYSVPATLHYQLCDDRMCFRPSTKSIEISVLVTSSQETREVIGAVGTPPSPTIFRLSFGKYSAFFASRERNISLHELRANLIHNPNSKRRT